ncbi:MAG: hypothetical protein OEZ23_00160 [Gammaproteobacteria bacterium]|nr:hypothetical protein [Gammaproteobacteria bacterium]
MEAFDKKLKQEGTLLLQTRIDIKGKYLKGPVPVSIRYKADFNPTKNIGKLIKNILKKNHIHQGMLKNLKP